MPYMTVRSVVFDEDGTAHFFDQNDAPDPFTGEPTAASQSGSLRSSRRLMHRKLCSVRRSEGLTFFA